MPAHWGLTDLVRGQADYKRTVVTDPGSGMHIMATGRNPPSVLSSARFVENHGVAGIGL